MPLFGDLVAEYARLWDTATIRPEHAKAVVDADPELRGHKSDYEQVSGLTTVPWFVVGLIHGLEAGFEMTRHLHNGNPLSGRTFDEPAGRPKGNPPFTWVQSAVDALTMHGLDKVGNWTVERIAFELERYNGWGYRKFHPNVLSPYLWSFTNQYTRGKYVGDHKFDPGFVSHQVGAMALLKQMVADGLPVTRQSGAGTPASPPPPPPPPAPTGLFALDGRPFVLRAVANGPPPDDGLIVMHDMPVEKIAEVGDKIWWEVNVTDDAGKHHGFAKAEWLRPVFAAFPVDEDIFAQSCLDGARANGTSAHFLIALASAETGITNAAGQSGAFGPFAMTKEDWSTYNDPAKTGFNDADRFNPYSQASVAARMLVKLTADIQAALPDGALPTSEQLYIARVLGVPPLKTILAGTQGGTVRDVLPQPDAANIIALRPTQLQNGNRPVADLRSELAQRLEAGFAKAVTLIQKVEPDLVFGPPEATETTDVPWMEKATGELAKGVHRFAPGASNPEIELYFTATTLGRETDKTAWCAAFVSWCIKNATTPPKQLNYSARAADWLENGQKLDGPQFGAVAVLKPLVEKSSGHVGFVVSFDSNSVKLLAGNQSPAHGQPTAVCEKDFPIDEVRGWRMV